MLLSNNYSSKSYQVSLGWACEGFFFLVIHVDLINIFLSFSSINKENLNVKITNILNCKREREFLWLTWDVNDVKDLEGASFHLWIEKVSLWNLRTFWFHFHFHQKLLKLLLNLYLWKHFKRPRNLISFLTSLTSPTNFPRCFQFFASFVWWF